MGKNKLTNDGIWKKKVRLQTFWSSQTPLRITDWHLRLLMATFLTLSLHGCAAKVPCVPPEKISEHIYSMGHEPSKDILIVDTRKQTLTYLQDSKIKKVYTVSTSNRGLGQRINTYKTPLGLHRINEKLGNGVPKYGIFHRRHYIGTAWKPQPRHKHLKDYISTRILRLEGLQPGFNRGRDCFGRCVDSEIRAVYIHGTTMEYKLGKPSTKGCVHMSAEDVIDLFNRVPNGTYVWIH